MATGHGRQRCRAPRGGRRRSTCDTRFLLRVRHRCAYRLRRTAHIATIRRPHLYSRKHDGQLLWCALIGCPHSHTLGGVATVRAVGSQCAGVYKPRTWQPAQTHYAASQPHWRMRAMVEQYSQSQLWMDAARVVAIARKATALMTEEPFVMPVPAPGAQKPAQTWFRASTERNQDSYLSEHGRIA